MRDFLLILVMQIKRYFSFIFILFSCLGFSQNLTGEQLLEKAIAYHDPNNNWPTFKGKFHITMEIPGKPNRDSKIVIDIPEQYFSLTSKVKEDATRYIIKKDSVTSIFNSNGSPSADLIKKHEKRAKVFKNYYTYLYGLPMKLKDPGTIIHEVVEAKNFKGKNYLVLKATYEKHVGKDTWYFYFDPKTYAMEIYQFFHAELENDGEYILLSEEEIINDIKMPKYRAWYLNKDNTLLGTDILNP